jgi:transcriptional regulator with XRE-family HTH domain
MARPERPIKESGPLADFARDLRAARAEAGLTYRQMAAITHLSIVTLSSAANGRDVPTWPVTAAYLKASGRTASEEMEWRRRWHSLRQGRESVESTRFSQGKTDAILTRQVRRSRSFRPAAGPYVNSAVLAELARLWEQSIHRAANHEAGNVTQKRLAQVSRVPLTTVNSWATGTSLPRNLDQLAAVGAGLARWAGEQPLTVREWDRMLRTDLLARSVPDRGAPAGRPIDELTDPFALEVHRPVRPENPQPDLPTLPIYVPRGHDTELGLVVRAAAEGSSGIAVLVGGSSTGKTRACWEALQPLRAQDPGWRLWHPVDPSRPDAALRELPTIGPRTVVWLNEAQFYLDADGGLGERVAAGLRALLRDPARGPVLVLATLWPQFWGTLTGRPGGDADTHAQARELLSGHDIAVPAAFTAAQLQRLGEAGDARLAWAATRARDGQVIQFLAGAPELLARYRNAPPAAAALIHAAMDARRMGMGIGLPRAFLEHAAARYLTGAEWDTLGEDWAGQALAYAGVPCKGVRGPLTPIRPRPATSRVARPGSRASGEQPASIPVGSVYRLADYLDQHGRQHRKDQIPPGGFWAAAAGYALPGDQAALGDAAHARGLYRDAAQLHKNAAAGGNLHAVLYLSNTPHYLSADVRPVCWAAAQVSLDDPRAVAGLLERLQEAGAQEQAAVLAGRAAAQVSLDEPRAVAGLLVMLQ